MNLSFISFLMSLTKKRTKAAEQYYFIKNKFRKIGLISLYKMEKLGVAMMGAKTNSSFEESVEENRKITRKIRLKIPGYIQKKIRRQLLSHVENSSVELSYLWQSILDENSEIRKVYNSIKDSQKSLTRTVDFINDNRVAFKQDPRSRILIGNFMREILDEESTGNNMIMNACQQIEIKKKSKWSISNISGFLHVSEFSRKSQNLDNGVALFGMEEVSKPY